MKLPKYSVLTALALAAAAVGTVPASAQNLVSNPSFESGFTGYYGENTLSGGGRTGDSAWISGCYSAACTSTYDSGSYFGQGLSTVAGQSYDLTFWVAELGGPTSAFSVFWNGQLINTTLNPNNLSQNSSDGTASYRQFTFNGLLATGAATDLQIHGRQDPGIIYFDDISVAATNGAVPEPATWAMMLLGFGLVGGALRCGVTGRRRLAIGAAPPAGW